MSDDLTRLIESLRRQGAFGVAGTEIELLETHISYVVLAGTRAYKFKKAIDLGFLDFSTLEKRRFYCEEELRLNRRLAPAIYRRVRAVTGTAEHPQFDGDGPAIEYALEMQRFDTEAMLDKVLARGELETGHVRALARRVAEFHLDIPRAPADGPFGTGAQIHGAVLENFDQLAACEMHADCTERVTALRSWSRDEFAALQGEFERRLNGGFVRECHGDLHLTNMVMIDREVVIFDCIEFSAALRWNDVISEIAFLLMDLELRGARRLAGVFLNEYLARTGDYAGISLLRFYLVYRSLVRAKVAAIGLRQTAAAGAAREALREKLSAHVNLAAAYAFDRPAAALIITHGLSGSGKTALAARLAPELDAVHIRSDLERKRLLGMQADTRAQAAPGAGIYSETVSARTYERLAGLAEAILDAGFSVLVDATFNARGRRDRFRAIAAAFRVPFVLLHVTAATEILRRRIGERLKEGRDASDADVSILEHQLARSKPLDPDELPAVLNVDTTAGEVAVDHLLQAIARKTEVTYG